MDAASHPTGEKADGPSRDAQADFPTPSVPAHQRGDCENQPDSAGLGAVLCGRPFEPVLLVHPRLGRKEDSAPSGARAPASRFRLEAVQHRVAVRHARTLPWVPGCQLTITRSTSAERLHNPCREAVQERVVRQIRMLRAMWRELETGLRPLLTGHEGETPDTAKERPSDYRASSRPYHRSSQQPPAARVPNRSACCRKKTSPDRLMTVYKFLVLPKSC